MLQKTTLRTLTCVVGIIVFLVGSRLSFAFDEPADKSAEATEKTDSDAKGDDSKAASEADTKADEKDAKEKETDDKDAKPEAKKAATHKVEKGKFKIELSVKGIFEAADVTEIVLRPEVWKSFEVVKAVDHGTPVKKGDRLVWLDMQRVNEEIRNRKHDVEMSYLSLRQAEEDLRFVEETAPLDREAVARAKKTAEEELERYLEIDRPQSEKSANFSFENYKNYLEYAQEELDQLEKMYMADDLTEETEEIILKRARRDVDSAKFSVDSSAIRTNRTLNIDLPRREVDLAESAKRARLTHEKMVTTLPITLERKRLELEKATRQHKKSEENLEQLEQDRKLMEITAPTDGIVYYGKNDRGKWSGAATTAQQLRQGGSISPNQVIVSIVKPRPMFIRIDVAEKDFEKIRPGVEGTAIPTAFPEMTLKCEVKEVSAIPISSGTFDGTLSVTLGDKDEMIVPGMACNVDLVPYEKKDAITLPKSSVFTDETNDEQQYVYLVKSDETPEKRDVTVGKKTDDKVEILSGLQPGDQILLKKPEEKKADEKKD